MGKLNRFTEIRKRLVNPNHDFARYVKAKEYGIFSRIFT